MNDKVEKLIKREEEIKERFGWVSDALNAIRRIPKIDRHFIEYPVMIRILEKKADHLKDMQMKVREKIAKEQSKCKHQHPDGSSAYTKYLGHGHNYSAYACVYCNDRIEK